jgi:serine/threonine protein kinase
MRVEHLVQVDFPLSASFLDRYELVEALTGGNMSLVFRAFQRALQRDVVIKFLHNPADAVLRLRFEREVLILKGMREPGILPLPGTLRV